MNRIKHLFNNTDRPLLSIYFTAGYPELDSTVRLAKVLQDAGADFIEIGFPYSDPLADGPVIQGSSQRALQNGMTLKVLFEQLKRLREEVRIPVLLMGYFNPVLQFGVEKFCEACGECGIDGLIIPDLPMDEYELLYKDDFLKNGLSNIFLVTPQTSPERIHKIDSLSNGFIYMLSSSATTGKKLADSSSTDEYFSRVRNLKLKNPTMVGFGISDHASFSKAAEYTRGAIVGTAFVKFLSTAGAEEKIPEFLNSIREPGPTESAPA